MVLRPGVELVSWRLEHNDLALQGDAEDAPADVGLVFGCYGLSMDLFSPLFLVMWGGGVEVLWKWRGR